jgi:predicted PurR-regulated permease PerM
MSDTRTDIRWLALIAMTVLAIYLCWTMLRPFLSVLVWSALLAILYYPAYRFVLRQVKRPWAAATLSLLLVIATVMLPVAFVTTAVVREFTSFASWAQDALLQLRTDPATAARFAEWKKAAAHYIDADALLDPEKITPVLQALSQALLARSAGFVGGLVGMLTSAVFGLFTLFYFFRDGDQIGAALPGILPLRRRQAVAIIERTRTTITASVYGVLVIALIQGTLGGIMFAILGLPSPVLWGVVMVIMATIPMAGAAVVWAPAAAILFLAGHPTKAAILFVFGALVIGTIDNFLRPKLVAERSNLHPLFIFFSVLGGLSAFGLIGLLIGPVVLAITMGLIEALTAVEAEEETAARNA